MAPTHKDGTTGAAESAYLLERARWLVRLRWFAIAGIGIASAAATITGFVRQPGNLVAVGVGLALCNVVSWQRLHNEGPSTSPLRLRRLVLWQLVADMGALALLTEFSGGAENPFQMLFALPAAMGAILLSRRQAVMLGIVGGSFEAIVVIGQFKGWLDHHGLHSLAAQHARGVADSLYRSPRFVAGYLLAFGTMLGGIIYLTRSITERHAQAEALRHEYERVAQSRERLARVGELSAGVAHSIRNPLHGLLNSVDLLKARVAGDAEAEETLALSAEALSRIERITRRLLSLTRDVPLEPAPCDFDALVADTARFSSPQESKRNIELVLGGVGTVNLDSNRFTEALNNLIENALHACRSRGTVTIRTFALGEPVNKPLEEASSTGGNTGDSRRSMRDCVAVEIEDTGHGIPPAQLSRVFDPFFTTKGVGEGTGLGLGIARRVAEEHGGHVKLDSVLGRSTRVQIILPRLALKGET